MSGKQKHKCAEGVAQKNRDAHSNVWNRIETSSMLWI